MKTLLLPALLTLVLASAENTRAENAVPPPLAAPETPAAAPAPPAPPAPGKAVITIDVDGRRETREIDLGNANVISLGKGGRQIAIRSDGDHFAPRAGEKALWLGVILEPISDDLRAQLPVDAPSGLILRSVTPDSPAAKAGLQKNDILTKLDDQLLLNDAQLRALIKTKHEGDTVHLTYLRHGQPGAVDAKLALNDHPAPAAEWDNDHSSLDDEGAKFSEELTRDVTAVTHNALKQALGALEVRSKAIVMDKNGKLVKVVGDDAIDIDTTLAALNKALHKAGLDDKTIAEAQRQVTEALKHDAAEAEKPVTAPEKDEH